MTLQGIKSIAGRFISIETWASLDEGAAERKCRWQAQRQQIRQHDAIRGNGQPEKRGHLKTILKLAEGGEGWAATIVANRLWPQRRGARFRLDLGDTSTLPGCIAAQAKIINAMSDGIISATEAAEYSAVIGGQIKLIETSEVIARLEALEAK